MNVVGNMLQIIIQYINVVLTVYLKVLEVENCMHESSRSSTLSCDFIFEAKFYSESWLNQACLFLKMANFKKMEGDRVLLLKNVVFLVI